MIRLRQCVAEESERPARTRDTIAGKPLSEENYAVTV